MNNPQPQPVDPGDFIDCGDGFWNARGSFKIGGMLELGSHASLIAMGDGRFLWLDSVTLTGDALDQAMALTDGGAKVTAILNLHPFHTLHCQWAKERFPNATMYGTARHKTQLPRIDWAPDNVESAAVAERFADLLDLSVPRGVDFISANERVHFSSVLALHKPSATIHSDDTLSYNVLPFLVRLFRRETPVYFHPTLGSALQPRAGAPDEFRMWSRELAARWKGAARLCAAHNGIKLFPDRDFEARMLAALARVEPVLAKHEARFD